DQLAGLRADLVGAAWQPLELEAPVGSARRGGLGPRIGPDPGAGDTSAIDADDASSTTMKLMGSHRLAVSPAASKPVSPIDTPA
ncbi:MAG TPA: hypothetical protein VM734_31950, partial [Kofleriaceae bacterium]|nr:hypothetical protein [Kofleriaceae bacterium]